MNEIKVNRKQLAEMLGVTLNTLKHTEIRGNLEKRLLQINFRFINKIKEGRSSFYIVELIEDIKSMTWEELCKKRKVRKKVSFKRHTWSRLNSIKGLNTLTTKSDFARKNRISIYDVNKFDGILLEENVMIKNGYTYVKWKNGIREYTTEEEYRNYWARFSIEKKLIDSLMFNLENGKISTREYTVGVAGIFKQLNQKGTVIHKIEAYKEGSEFDKIATLIEENNQIKFNI